MRNRQSVPTRDSPTGIEEIGAPPSLAAGSLIMMGEGVEEKDEPRWKTRKRPVPIAVKAGMVATPTAAYHPSFMQCGACTGCADVSAFGGAAPPPLSQMAFALDQPNEDALPVWAVGEGKTADASADGDRDAELALPTSHDYEQGEDMHEFTAPPQSQSSAPSPTPNLHHRSEFLLRSVGSESQLIAIQSVLRELSGVVSVDVLTQQAAEPPTADTITLLLHHDPLIVRAESVESTLKSMGFDAVLADDGGLALTHHPAAAAPSTDTLDGTAFTSSASSQHGVCRSQLFVRGICCSSEVPAVTSILQRIGPAVVRVSVNVTARIVYVHHDAFAVSASDLVAHLRKGGFPCRVRRDGAAFLLAQHQSQSRGAVNEDVDFEGDMGRSDFVVHSKLPLDASAIQSVLTLLPGVVRVNVSTSTGAVEVHHDTSLLSATRDLAPTLEKTMAAAEESANADIKQTTVSVERDAIEAVLHRRQKENRQPVAIPTAPSSSPEERDSLSRTVKVHVESTIVINCQHVSSNADFERIQRAVRQQFSKEQVRAQYIHTPSRSIKLEHDPALVSARAIADVISNACSGKNTDRNALGAYTAAATTDLEAVDASTSTVVVAVDGGLEGLVLPNDSAMDDDDSDDEVNEDGGGILSLNVILSGFFWVISIVSFLGGRWRYLEYAGLLSVFFGIPPVALKAVRTVRRRQFDANCMMVVAAFGALALGEFDEAASVAFLFAVSELLEASATARARKALGDIVDMRPEHANAVHRSSGEVTVVPVASLKKGSVVSVRTGDRIPADGAVLEGTSSVDESSLTGEAIPIKKKVGDCVSAGSINVGSTRLLIRTVATVEDSAFSMLIRLVEEAQMNRSPTEKLIDAFARRYTPFVVLVAAVMCTMPWAFGAEMGRQWTLKGLIVVVIACPCALTISTPVTYSAGLGATARRGVIVKGGARLEALGRVKRVVFDKTGTLTKGKFSLLHLDSTGDRFTRQELLELLAIMEAPSSHPLAETLVNAAKNEGVKAPKETEAYEHTTLKGEGVTAVVNGKRVYVGNSRLFRRLGHYEELDEAHKTTAQLWGDAGGTVGFVGIEDEGIVGLFCVSDTVRDEAPNVIRALRAEGVDVLMLTGDAEGPAKAVAQEVGISEENVKSQLMPEDKLHFIGSLRGSRSARRSILRRRELVAMVGDGVNDAPALAVADVGVAMGGGAALASEISDVTIMDSNLGKFVEAIRMGSKVILTIQENIAFSILAKVVVVCLTFAGRMSLLGAIASDVGVMLMVTLNGMKLLPERGGTHHSSESGGQAAELQESEVRLKRRSNQYNPVASTESVELPPVT